MDGATLPRGRPARPSPRPTRTASVLVAPVADGPDGDAAARAALEALGIDAGTLLATHEPRRHRRHGHRRAPRPRRPRGAAGRCSSASATARTPPGARPARPSGARPAARGEVVHAVGDTASGSALAAYVETVVLASWASPRWTREGAVAGCAPVADRRRHRHDGCRRRAARGRAGPGPARRPRAGRDPVEHQEPGLAGPPGAHRGAAHRPRGAGVGRAPAAGRRLRRHPRRRPGLGHPAAAGAARPRARGRDGRHAAGRARRQGHHVRHRWAAGQAGRRHGRDEDRHVRRGHRARGALGLPRARRAGARHRPARHRRERRRGRLVPPRRRHHPLRRAHRRDRQHRRRGPHRHGRRARLRRRPPRPRLAGRRRDADRRGPDRPRPGAGAGVRHGCRPHRRARGRRCDDW